jgi:hypothetical protein
MPRPRHLSPSLRRLVTPDALYLPPAGRLTAAQAATLVEAARTPNRFDTAISVPRALIALARGAGAGVAVPVLAQMLGRKTADVPTRVVAAYELALIATPQAERALWRGIADAHPRVVQEALWGLGAIGGPAALRRLATLPTPPDAATRRQLAFARALISHRHGLAGGGLTALEAEPRRPEQVGDRAALALALQSAAETQEDGPRLEGTTYGIALSSRSASLTCGTDWTIFFNRELELAAMAKALSERPWVVGLMARKLREQRSMAVARVILAQPEGDGVRLDIVRGDGVRVYTGRATTDGTVVRFTIGDVERPGTAPAFVRGRIGPRGIDIEESAVSSRRVGTRPTVAVPVSALRKHAAATNDAGERPADKGEQPWR